MEGMRGAGGRAYFGPSDREDISAEALFVLKDEKPVFSAPGQEQSRPGEDHAQKPWERPGIFQGPDRMWLGQFLT